MDQAREAAQAVTDFFSANPFTTAIGQRIERATEGSDASEDWGLIMEICDYINHTEEGPRDAVRAVRKRMQTQMGKNNTSVMYTLTVLETCVKNCDRRLHAAVCQKDFVQELVRLIGPKSDPPQIVQERVLSLIQSWADAFRGTKELSGVCEVYDDLKAKGVQFPMTNLDAMAPIITPQRAAAEGAEAAATGPVAPNSEQLAKLRSELDIVNGNLRVLREMLSELAPGREPPDDLALMRQLHHTCRSMQRRVLALLDGVANEEVTNELLVVNDELNNVFLKFDRYMANREQSVGVSNGAVEAAGAAAAAAAAAPIDEQLEALQMNPAKTAPSADAADQFDMFAQTRSTTFEESRQAGSTYADNSTGLDQIDVSLGEVAQQRTMTDGVSSVPAEREREIQEIESWLKTSDGDAGKNDATTKEFDQFLAGRAQGDAPPRPRDEDEQKLFGL